MSARVARNSAANLLGALLPALVALATIPFIVSRLGEASYGVLALVTAIVGYFAVLDLNLTSGSVKYVAQYHAVGRNTELNQVITFGAVVYLGIGVGGCLLIAVFAELLATRLFNVPDHLVAVTESTLKLAAIGFVFGQMQSYLHSIPQSLQRYDISAALEASFGILVPVLSVAVLWLGYGLFEIVLLRVAVSIVNVTALAIVVRKLLPSFRFATPSRSIVRQLASFSGFAYLSRLAAITYAEGDKLIIGATAGVAALTYYVVPFTLMNRLFAMSYRLGGVIYPLASELQSRNEMARLKDVYFSATRYVFFVNALIVLLATLLAHEILFYWMGPEFARQGSLILSIVAIASLVDSTTNLPSLVNDGLGRPKVTGLFAVGRALLGLAVIYGLVTRFGILGAAIGHLIASCVVATAFLVYVHKRSIPFSLVELFRRSYVCTLPALFGLFVAGSLLKPEKLSLAALLITAGTVAILYALYGYRYVLATDHRSAIGAFVRRKLAT